MRLEYKLLGASTYIPIVLARELFRQDQYVDHTLPEGVLLQVTNVEVPPLTRLG